MTKFYESNDIVLDDGKEYGFHVEDATEGDEHKGKPTMQMKLRVIDKDGELDGQVIQMRFFAFMVNKLAATFGFERKNDGGKLYFEVDGCDFIGKEFAAVNNHNKPPGGEKTFNQLDLKSFKSLEPVDVDGIPF